ncbi:MAG: gluconate 2-dehydrogenase subunit 3 family protein, partial [Acidobacteriaceae bacterium]
MKSSAKRQPGYYPGYDILSQQKFWDETTRATVLKRVNQIPKIRFFSPEQARLMEAVLARILPQDDREINRQPRIPLLGTIDERLHSGRIDGYRFEDMPPDREAYVLGLKAIDQIANSMHHRNFADLAIDEQEALLKSLHDGKPPAAHEIWERLPVARFWMLLLQDAIEAYYAHPDAWNEIGFGGPAYPR